MDSDTRYLLIGLGFWVLAFLLIRIWRKRAERRQELRYQFFAYVQHLGEVGEFDELKRLLEKEKNRWGKEARLRRRRLRYWIRREGLVRAGREGRDVLETALYVVLQNVKPSRVDKNEILSYAYTTMGFDSRLGCDFLLEVAGILRRSFRKKNRALAKEFTQDARWFGLEGNELEIEGLFNDKTELDWSAYRGKVTLLFGWNRRDWTSLYMLPVVRVLYRKYHSQGFEVLGYNSQDGPKAVRKFEEKFKIPWRNVSRRLTRRARKASGERYQDVCELWGLDHFLLLVDRDGVAHFNALAASVTDALAASVIDATDMGKLEGFVEGFLQKAPGYSR